MHYNTANMYLKKIRITQRHMKDLAEVGAREGGLPEQCSAVIQELEKLLDIVMAVEYTTQADPTHKRVLEVAFMEGAEVLYRHIHAPLDHWIPMKLHEQFDWRLFDYKVAPE